MVNLIKHGHLVWPIWPSHEHFGRPFKKFVPLEKMYDLTFGQNGNFSRKNQPWKNHVSFMPHAFNQNKHPFGQCRHLNSGTWRTCLWWLKELITVMKIHQTMSVRLWVELLVVSCLYMASYMMTIYGHAHVCF